jgi:hypothetical protein
MIFRLHPSADDLERQPVWSRAEPSVKRDLAAGKPAKVAITACSRKLLTIINAIARSKRPWQELPA